MPARSICSDKSVASPHNAWCGSDSCPAGCGSVAASAVSAVASEASDLGDESGAIRADIVEQVAAAIEGNNRAALADLIGGWHEADLGDLLAALDPDLR